MAFVTVYYITTIKLPIIIGRNLSYCIHYNNPNLTLKFPLVSVISILALALSNLILSFVLSIVVAVRSQPPAFPLPMFTPELRVIESAVIAPFTCKSLPVHLKYLVELPISNFAVLLSFPNQNPVPDP